MEMDLDLIRKILFWAVEQEHANIYRNPVFDEYSDEQVGYHVYLMEGGGLVEAVEDTIESESPHYMLERLTVYGHEFVAMSRKDSFWQKAKKEATDITGEVGLELMIEILRKLARGLIGSD